MASEYWKWKFKDVKPEETRELTPRERRKNWWFYHKWHIACGAALLLIVGSIAWNALRQTRPDYQIAYVGAYALPGDTAAALEAGLSALGEDLNGDGTVTVRLVQYALSTEADPQVAAAAEVQLTADIMECQSYFFLLEDPEWFQQAYHSLCRLDGSLPPEDDASVEEVCLPWDQCPVLAQMDLGEYVYPLMGGTAKGDSNKLLSRLFIARRGFWTEKTVPNPQGYQKLWDKLTEGAF